MKKCINRKKNRCPCSIHSEVKVYQFCEKLSTIPSMTEVVFDKMIIQKQISAHKMSRLFNKKIINYCTIP